MQPSELLSNSEYLNANAATKEAVFNQVVGQLEDFTSANKDTQDAIKLKFGLVGEEVAPEVPTEETDAQIAARARGELIPEGEGYLKGLYGAGAGAAKSTTGGIMQFAGAEESGREFSKAGQEQGKNYPSVSDIPALYREEGLLSAIKGAGRAIPYDIARTVPVIGAGLGAGAVATVLAPEAALAGLGAATLAELGVYGLSATGENMNRQQAQIDAGTRKDFDRGAAVASGMAQGVLEKVGVNQILGKAGAIGERIAQQLGTKTAAEEILAASTRTGLRTAGRVIGGIAETGAVEGGVEALQEGLGRAQAGESLTDKEALEAYGSSALGGVLVGGAMRAPFATAEGLSSKDKAIKKIEDFGNVGLDVLSGNVALTPEQFKANGTLMAEGIARNTVGSEGEKTSDQAFEELKTKVKSQEQFDREFAEKQAGLEGLSQTQLPDEFADEFAGAPRAEAVTEEEVAPELRNRRQQDIFKMGDVGPTETLQVTPSGEALLNQEQIDAQDFRRLAEKQHQELIDAGVKSEATKEMSRLLEKTRVGTQVDLVGGKKGTLKEEVIPARTQDFGTAPVQEDIVTRAEQQATGTAKMSKLLEKTKEGAQVDLFGGKKGKLKEEVIPEAKVAETVAPKQEDIVDEAKKLEVPHLLTALKGLTQTAEGGPHPDTLLGKEPTGQRKATDFATAVHAEVGAKDTDVITPAHVAEAGVRDLELGKVIEKAGGLPISDPKVSTAINKLTPEKQVALTNVLSKEYSPENYIKPSEMLVSKQELLNLNIPPQSTLVKDLFNKPKVESINVVNNPIGAKQLVTQLVAVSKNKNAPPAVQAAALQKAVTIEQTLAKVKAANNKAVAAKAVTTKGTDTNIVTKDDVAYSVAPVGITTGHTVASLSKALSPEMKRLVASGKAILHDTAATLPGTGHPVNVQGMTTADGVTHYVANKLTPSTIQNVALHEVGVHAGMRKMLGDKLWSYVKDQAMTNQGAAFVKARASVPEGTPDHLIAEEVLAYLVENSPSLSIVRQIIASIRNFMRSKLGANIKLSEADARQMATAAMRKESKTAERTSREETAYSVNKGGFNGNVSKFKKIAGSAKEKLPAFLEMFGAAGINSIAGKLLQGVEVNGIPSKNSASEILKQTRKIAGMTNKLLNEYLPIRKEINAYIKKNYRQVPILGDVANEATLLGVSPAEKDINNPNNIQNRIKSELDKGLSGYADRVKRLRALETRFKQLNPESITMYTKLSDYYKKAYQDYTNAELARIDTADLTDTEKDRQRDIFNQQMADTKLRGDYFPVMRFGKYSVEYTDGDIDDVTGELISKFNKFETEAEATEFASNPKIKTKGARLDIERDRSTVLTGNKTIKDIWDNIDRTFKGVKGQKDLDDAIDDMKDFVFQMNLMGRPEQSIGKRFLHRKGTPGYSNDIFRGFDNYALSMSKQLPRIEMSHGITSKLTKLEKELGDIGADKIDAVRYYNAFNKQIINSVYPKQIWDFTNTLTGAVFHYYLTSPVSAALQLASIPIQGAPSIAKQHGIKIAQSSLNAATSLYLGSGIGRKTGWWDIKRGAMNHKDIQKFVKGATHANQLNIPDAVDRMREEALLVPGVHAQAFGGGNKSTKEGNTPFDKAKHVMELTSRPFAEMETASRQIVSVAAYIANIKSGMTHDAAVRKAIDTTYIDMGDYGETGKAAIFKTGFGGLAKVAMQFQQYGAKLLFAMSKAGYDAVKGEDAKTKSQARKFLAHTFAMHYVFAGALGLPLIGLVGAATDFVRDLKDDEERHSFKEDLRIALHSENIDDMWINLILNGPVGTITGLDLTDRIGAADLIPMVQESDLNETLKGEVVGKALQSFGGAAASTASNFEKAIDQFTEGNYGKAFEKLLPSSIRNVITAARYANEGKLTAGGLPIVSKEEISGWDIVARALGAESSHMAEKSKASRSAHMANQFIMDRKKELLDKFAKADPRERQETILEMQRFTRRHPGASIGMDTIRSSLKSRLMAVHTATRGYQLGKNKAEIKRLFPELEDDDFNDGDDED